MPPKTASNSLKFTLENYDVHFEKDNIILPEIHLKLKEIYSRYNLQSLDEYKIIQITRNPYERYVSAYFFMKKIIPKNSKIFFENFDIGKFSEHLIESKKQNDFVETFYGDTSFVNQCISSGRSWGGSRLFDTQKSWCDMDVKISYFKLEELTHSTKKLSEFLDLPIRKLSHINSQNISTEYRTLINENVRKIIFELYYEDFTDLGYEI